VARYTIAKVGRHGLLHEAGDKKIYALSRNSIANIKVQKEERNLTSMQITIKCEDCGRSLGTVVRLGKQRDLELKVHACYHSKLHNPPEDTPVAMGDIEIAKRRIGRQTEKYGLLDSVNL